jgi:hypothetical protein
MVQNDRWVKAKYVVFKLMEEIFCKSTPTFKITSYTFFLDTLLRHLHHDDQ